MTDAAPRKKYRVTIRVGTGTNVFTLHADDINDLYARLEQLEGVGPTRNIESVEEITQ